MSPCNEQLLGAYFDDELAPEARFRVEAHLRDCPACARQLEMLRDASRLLRDYPFQDITGRERMRLHEAVDAAIDRPIWRIGASLGLIAASILIVGLAWLNALVPGTAPVNSSPVASAPAAEQWEKVAMTLRTDWAPTQAEDQVQLADSMVAGLSSKVLP
jgi:anti-sigma factor RsiW